MTKKKIWMGVALGIGVVGILSSVAAFVAYRYFGAMVASQLKAPSYLESPLLLIGGEFISKNLFLEDARLRKITDIVLGELDPSPGLEIGIAGSYGALFVSESGTVKSAVSFSAPADHVNIIDVDNDNVCEFLNRGSWAISPSLIDHQGNTLWTYGGMIGVNDMAAGAIDGDGLKEFVVGFNGGGGVHRTDKNGKKKWQQPDVNVWHVELADTNADGKLKIVHSNAAGEITVRDGQGKIIRRAKPAEYFSHFSLSKWPSKRDKEYALLAANDLIWLFDFDGTSVKKFDAPKCGTQGHARGVAVKIKNDEPEYFAVLVELKLWNRAILYIYDPTGVLVYQEILPDASAAIAAIALNQSETETLLIGGEGKVWAYRVKDSGLSR